MTLSNVGPAVNLYYDRLLLEAADDALLHTQFASVRTLPENHSGTIKFRRYENLAAVPTPLTEGQTPAGTALSTTDITATVMQYGNYIRVSDQIQKLIEDPIVNVCAKKLGYNMALTMDILTRDVLASCASVVECSGGSNGNTPTELSKSDIDFAVQQLLINNAMMMTEVVQGEDRANTFPIRPAFMGILHADLIQDLENVANFKEAASYASVQKVMNREWGSTGNVRWLYTSIGFTTPAVAAQSATSTTAATPASPMTYTLPIIGKEAYARVNLGANGGESLIVKPLGSGGASDPIDQRATVGWKRWYTTRILNDNFMTRLICSAKAA